MTLAGRRAARPDPAASPSPERRLTAAMVLNLAIALVEVAGGLVAGSLSLVSDALHNVSDGAGLLISLIARRLAGRRNSLHHTFGLKRAEILAAVVNAAALLFVSLYLFYEAAAHLVHPAPVRAGFMVGVGLVGLVANLGGTLLLHRDSAGSLNVRSSYLHLLGDAASSLAVVAGGVAIAAWNAYWLDPLLTVAIGLYVLLESYRVLMQAIHVLMEGTPPGLDLHALRSAVEALPGVENMHHIHVWAVGENDLHLVAHRGVEDVMVSETHGLRGGVEALLRSTFGIGHVTVQLECGHCPDTGLIKT